MPNIIVLFETAMNKVNKIRTSDATVIRRTLLYILMPFLKLATIARCGAALGLAKNGLYRALERGSEKDWLAFLRALSYARTFAIMRASAGACSAKKSRLRITICCDDSGFAKSGKKMPLVGLMWDHVLKRVCPGTQALYFFVVVGDGAQRYPLDLRLCRGRGGKGRPGRPSKKKTQLALDMLRDFAKSAAAEGLVIERVSFVADSWFVGKDLFKECRKLNISAVVKGKSGLVFRIKGNRIKGGDLRAMEHQWRTYEGPAGNVYARYEAVSPTLGDVVLTVVKEGKRIYYLIGSNYDHTSPKMIADHKLRWDVEVYFRDSKQTLGLGVFRFGSRVKITAHFVLRSISYHFADWIRRKKFKGRKTIGECVEFLYERIFSKLIHGGKKIGIHEITDAFADFIKAC